MGQPEVGPGFYPTVMHQYQMHQEDPGQWGVVPSSILHGAEVMAKIRGSRPRRKYNIMAQAIPIYGFGILLYILYIIYKLTCKGKAGKSGNSLIPSSSTEHEEIIDYELGRPQETLQQADTMMERIVSKKRQSSKSGRRRKSKGTASKKEEKLLFQLRQFTQLMQEGRWEGASPEMEAEEVPYGADWEGYPEETYPVYDNEDEYRDDDEEYKMLRAAAFTLSKPSQQPSAEALAERMEQVEEQATARKLSIVREVDEEEDEEEGEETEEDMEEEEDEEEEEEAEAEKRLLLGVSLAQSEREERLGLELSSELQGFNGGKKQISFSEHRDVFHYPKEDTYEDEEEDDQEGDGEEEDEGEEEADEDDPVIEAESLQFSGDDCLNPEEEAEQDAQESSFTSEDGGGGSGVHLEVPRGVHASGLRMRNRRET